MEWETTTSDDNWLKIHTSDRGVTVKEYIKDGHISLFFEDQKCVVIWYDNHRVDLHPVTRKDKTLLLCDHEFPDDPLLNRFCYSENNEICPPAPASHPRCWIFQQEGNCFNRECPFVHDTTIDAPTPICVYYNNGNCSFSECPFAHIEGWYESQGCAKCHHNGFNFISFKMLKN